jgi:3-deoxy-D-manno-octulosonic-acid transferase
MRLLYSLLLTLVAILLVPWALYRALVQGRSLGNLSEKFGVRPFSRMEGSPPLASTTVWVHAVSVGEVLAARALCQQLRREIPELQLLVTTTTVTGQELARTAIPEADVVGYFPLDWMVTVRRALRVARPSLVILMESELWYNFLFACREGGIPVLVANGRISDRTYRRASWMRRCWIGRRWLDQLYGSLSLVGMQSEIDRDRVVSLGAPAARVHVTGNLKYDPAGAVLPPAHDSSALPQAQGQKKGEPTFFLGEQESLDERPLIIAGSTHPEEEVMLLDAYRALRVRLASSGGGGEKGKVPRLLIAPRHPERFEEVSHLMESSGYSMVRRSSASSGGAIAEADLLLLDTIGELGGAYRSATLVFVGGSLVPRGGHNLLEPAGFSKPVITGPHMQNFREIVEVFHRHGALWQLQIGTREALVGQLAAGWELLLRDSERARQLGERGRAAIEANRGATTRTVSLVLTLLGKVESVAREAAKSAALSSEEG